MAVSDISTITFGSNTYNLKDPTKYVKPAGGIPETDLSSDVQARLDKADSALQSVPGTYRTAAAQDVIDNGKAPIIFETASGSVASFQDGADGLPLKTLVVNIEPKQLGSGDPSPENVRAISGWGRCNVTRTGKNLFDGNFQPYISNYDGTIWFIDSRSAGETAIVPVVGGLQYTISKSGGNRFIILEHSEYPQASTEHPATLLFNESGATSATVSTSQNTKYLTITTSNNRTTAPTAWTQVELGPIASVYTCSVIFPGSAGIVYCGTLTINEDGTGELKKRPHYRSYNSETLVGPWISDRDVYTPGTTPTIGALVIDLGGEETVYQLTAQQITTLLGTNNIWANCGDVEVTYSVDTKLFVEKQSSVTTIPNAGSVSSTGVISIKHDTTELFTVQLPLYNGGVSNGTSSNI